MQQTLQANSNMIYVFVESAYGDKPKRKVTNHFVAPWIDFCHEKHSLSTNIERPFIARNDTISGLHIKQMIFLS